MASGVLHREVRTARVGQGAHPGEPEMDTQGLDVAHLAVTAVGGGPLGARGTAGAPRVEKDQPAVRGQATQITEISDTCRPSGQADHEFAGLGRPQERIARLTGMSRPAVSKQVAKARPDGPASPPGITLDQHDTP